jgi:STE24 endopeptidase
MLREGFMRRRRLAQLLAELVLFWGIFAFPAILRAQETPTVRTPPPQQLETPATQPPPNAPTEIERYTLSHDRYEKAVRYSRAGYALYFCSVFVGFAVLLLALRTGLVGRLRDFAQRKTENRFMQGLIFIPILVLILRFADLPVHIIWHALSLHYQQSVQGWGSWLLDWSKAALVLIAFYVIMGLLVFFAIRWSPRC